MVPRTYSLLGGTNGHNSASALDRHDSSYRAPSSCPISRKGVMAIADWPGVLQAAGVEVQLHNNFPNDPHPVGSFQGPIKSLFWHHDATPTGPTPGGLDWILSSYNAGSPSAQMWMDYQGKWHFVGTGIAYHAGVVRGPLTNQNSAGLEMDHTTGETYTAKQLDSLYRGSAAIARHEGRDSDFITFHKIEARPRGRKQDPWFDSGSNNEANWDNELNFHRNRVQEYIKKGSNQPGLPDAPNIPEGEDDEMMRLVRIQGRIATFAGCPGRFIHVESPDHYGNGVALGLWKDEVTDTTDYQVDLFRDNCIGNGQGKGDNFTGLPSSLP